MSARIIPFPDPDAPLEGAAREAALAAFQIGVAELAHKTVCQAFDKACRIPGAGALSFTDAIPAFIDAFRRELNGSACARSGETETQP